MICCIVNYILALGVFGDIAGNDNFDLSFSIIARDKFILISLFVMIIVLALDVYFVWVLREFKVELEEELKDNEDY